MRSAAARLAAAACVVTVACTDLTEVTSLGVVQPDAVNNATGAVARFAGAVKHFATNFQAAVQTTGTFTDELMGTDFVGNDGEGFLTDARRPFTPGFPTTRSSNFTSFSGALQNFAYATEALKRLAPTPASRIGEALTLTGYTELFLAEQYCSGIPFSTITVDGVVTYGSGTSTTDTYLRALAHFDSALTLAADSARVLNLARVGRGRTLLDLARFADAAAAVAAVPTSYVYNVEYSATISGQQNGAFSIINTTRFKSVADRDGGVGLDFRSANDPRVPVVRVGTGTDGVSPVFQFGRFTSLGSPITLASGIEARLIQAEAALQANRNDASPTGTGWLGILNSLRASAITPAMAPLADPGSFDARVDLLFRERALWMFLTTHRMGDVRRLVRQYGRAVNSVYPSGNWKDGLPFGNEVDFDIPLSEAPNPNFKGCERRGA